MRDSDKSVDGQSFYAEHLTGSGTILPDGTYGEPEPDPTVQRGGPAGEHTSPGGVERPRPESLVPPARQREDQTRTTTQSAKRGNAASK